MIDSWDGQTYTRVYALHGGPVSVGVQQEGPLEAPILRVNASATRLPSETQSAITALLERVFGLRINLNEFYELADSDVRLRPLARQFRGLKPPRFPTVFEAIVNAIACQMLSITVGIHMLNRLAETCGLTSPEPDEAQHAFPRPVDLAAVDQPTMNRLGFSGKKSHALNELAQAIANGGLDLERLVLLDDASVVARLSELRGVSRWSSEYALLRGLGRLGVFPGDDVGARNNLAGWLGLPGPLDYAGVQSAVAPWQPYAGLVYFHLLLERLTAAGYVKP